MNVVFISPHFPTYFHQFTQALRKRGVNVLGIGDAPYDYINNETKESLVEYYRVNSLENYDEVYRAVGFFIGKYGRIDYIESQNEFWLETEAKLRDDFNVASGTRVKELIPMKFKSKMKDVYKKAGIPTARYKLIKSKKDIYKFIEEVGYPVVIKPDNGVGAVSTYKLSNDKDVVDFLKHNNLDISFILEEYVEGNVETFDGITNSKKEILICSSHIMLGSIMDTVNDLGDISFYNCFIDKSDIKEIGTKAVQAFDTRKKFFHFEFIRLAKNKPGLGKKGDLVGLEVNMRAPGAYIPDMINYANSVSVYDIWADMLVSDTTNIEYHQDYCIGYVGLRDGIKYANHIQQIKMKYGDKIISNQPVPEALSAAMGNRVYIVRGESEKELLDMFKYIMEKEKPVSKKRTTKKIRKAK